jgi:hypothetical protein
MKTLLMIIHFDPEKRYGVSIMNIIEQAEAVVEQALAVNEHMAQFVEAFDHGDIDELKRLFTLADSDSVLDEAIHDFTEDLLGPPPSEQELAEAKEAVDRIKAAVWRGVDGIPLARCPYCGVLHAASSIDECPLKPEQ